jgi:GAF domain-containing protein
MSDSCLGPSLATLGVLGYLRATVMAGLRPRDGPRLEQLAEEQAALRRVATLVAQGAPAETLFARVAEQVADVLRVPVARIVHYEDDGTATERASFSDHGEAFRVGTRWSLDGPSVVAWVRDSGRPARIDDYTDLEGPVAESVRSAGMRSTVGSPIIVAGRLWGAMVVSAADADPLPPTTEAQLADFTELVATAIANGEAREDVQRLADEQAALRRVATLVAHDVVPGALFGAVAREVGTLLHADFAGMGRFHDTVVMPVATWSASGEHPPVPERWEMQPGDPASMIAEARRPMRWNDWSAMSGEIASFVRDEMGVRSTVGCPIVVEGRLWGALAVHSKQREPLPPDTESRIEQFADLVATAVANAEARTEVARLAEEQAALRRVATLVAREAPETEVFAAIAAEIKRLVGTENIRMWRFEPDRTGVVVASVGELEEVLPIGSRHRLEGENPIARVFRTGKPARADDYRWATGPIAEAVRAIGVRSAVATPILVEGRLWGAVITGTTDADPLPAGTEVRLAQFTELLATAIANADARAEVQRLADEQAALRRVAMLVAQGASPAAIFEAVAAEMERVLDADGVLLSRYEPGTDVTIVAQRGSGIEGLAPGSRVSHEGRNLTSMVRRTERPARMETYAGTHGDLAQLVESLGVRAGVAAPIVVDGRLWGVIVAEWRGDESPPADTEERMAKFAQLLDTAIANADSRDQLRASRVRLLTAADEARRRVVRDLHDGAQQRLVHTIVTLKLARRALRDRDEEAEALLREALEQAEEGNAELRELAHGILPAVLTRGGLRDGVGTVVSRLDLPVHVDLPAERFPAEVEASAYFIIAESLTNVVKHSGARRAEVSAQVRDRVLHVEVRDDGAGGADPHGHGLVGIRDRVTALGGRLEVQSPRGGGTVVAASLPLAWS